MISEMKIRLPVSLKPGGKIGIVAPAGPFDRETFFRGIRILEEMGFEVYVPEKLFEARGYLAGTDEHRAGFVNQLFADSRFTQYQYRRIAARHTSGQSIHLLHRRRVADDSCDRWAAGAAE